MKIFSRAFATVDILIAIALMAGLTGIIVSYLNNNFTVAAGTVASCSQESALLSDAIACTRAKQAGGGGTTCADVNNCVSTLATKWPDVTADGAGNLSIGTGTGANNVADNEVTCAGAPATLTLNCTDDTFGTGGNTCTPVTEICGNNIDDDCDGDVDEQCSNGSTCPCSFSYATLNQNTQNIKSLILANNSSYSSAVPFPPIDFGVGTDISGFYIFVAYTSWNYDINGGTQPISLSNFHGTAFASYDGPNRQVACYYGSEGSMFNPGPLPNPLPVIGTSVQSTGNDQEILDMYNDCRQDIINMNVPSLPPLF